MLCDTPPELPRRLMERARSAPAVRTGIVNANSSLVMQSARLATEKNLIEPVFVGDRDTMLAAADDINWNIGSFQFVASTDRSSALDAAILAGSGEIGALMKGDVHTDDLVRAVSSREAGLRTDRKLSHVFHLTVPGSDDSICITDAVINVSPSVHKKLEIARNATSLMHVLGNSCPNIAVLSAIEEPIESIPSSMEAHAVVQRAKGGKIGGANIDGPMSFDLAVSADAARIKAFESVVAGRADVLLVPNIETGNALFKQMVYFMGATAAGIMLGAKVPVLLTSRADPPVARAASAALACLVAAATADQN